MEDCPDGVSGDIYIAGKGLAKEYFKDKEMTDQKFIFLPRIGEYLFCTYRFRITQLITKKYPACSSYHRQDTLFFKIQTL